MPTQEEFDRYILKWLSKHTSMEVVSDDPILFANFTSRNLNGYVRIFGEHRDLICFMNYNWFMPSLGFYERVATHFGINPSNVKELMKNICYNLFKFPQGSIID